MMSIAMQICVEPWTSQPTTSVAQSGQLEANGHRSSPLIKQGYLRKKSSSLLKAWKSYYFKLDTLGHLTYQSEVYSLCLFHSPNLSTSQVLAIHLANL